MISFERDTLRGDVKMMTMNATLLTDESSNATRAGQILRDLNRSHDIVAAVSVQSVNYCYLAAAGLVVGFLQSWVRGCRGWRWWRHCQKRRAAPVQRTV